jgi:hypothetical protein
MAGAAGQNDPVARTHRLHLRFRLMAAFGGVGRRVAHGLTAMDYASLRSL